MSSEHDGPGSSVAAASHEVTPWLAITRQSGAPADDTDEPLNKLLIKRALFPRRANPVQIGRFTVLGLLGRGGMGVVYACYDDLLDRKVAVKVLHGEVASEHATARLQREAQALAKLNHPNVVAIHDVGTLGERVYLAMEFVDGQTLGAWHKAAAPGWREVLRVILAAGDGLAAAHAKGLVHRDIKPDNIMVAADGRVRVMDFGLASIASDAVHPGPSLAAGVARGLDALSADLTRTGALIGTPAYMSAEQMLGAEIDARTDQYSLCATAWAALYGQAAFAGDTLAVLRQHVITGAVTPPPAGNKVPAWLRRVLERGLQPRAADRYPDTRALLQALRADPTRERWIAGVAIGSVAAALAVWGARTAVAQRAEAACTAAGAAIDGDWNDETRAALERAFLATGKPFAATTHARTMPWFDRWAASWRAAETLACRAHTIDETWDADLFVRAEDCLGEARGNFTALVRELAGVDASGLARATSAAAGLQDVDACTRPEALRERPMMRPAQRDEVLAVRARLARAASLEAAGDYTRGLDAARRAVVAARAAGWAPLRAQVGLRVASLAERLGDYRAAEADLRGALAAAGEARSPGLALAAAIDLVYVVGYRSSRHAEGAVWAESAQLQLALMPGEHPLERADLRNNRAGLAYVTGDYDAATQLYAEALALREGALGRDHPRVAESLNNLAGARYAQGAHDEAAALYGRALAVAEQALGPDHPQVATTLSNLSLVHQSTGAYAEALRVLTRAAAIREAALGEAHPQTANGLSNLALVHEAMGANDEAARLLTRALALHERALGPDHPQVADDAHNLATVRFATGDLDEAARLFRRAMTIYERLVEKDHPMTANSLAGLAQVHFAREQYAEALPLYTRALEILEASLGPDHPSVAHALHGLGETLAGLGRTAAAVAALERAVAIRSAASVPPDELAESRFALARALGPGHAPRARALAEQALQAYQSSPGPAPQRAAIAAWLAEHAASPPR